MKSLTASLALQLLLGSMVALSASLGIQAYRFHGQAVESAGATVARAMDDVEWEIARHRRAALTSALLVARTGGPVGPSSAEARAAGAGSFSPEIVLNFDGADEPSFLVGPDRGRLAGMIEAIRAASVAGITGADEPNSAVVVVDGEPMVVAAANRAGDAGGRIVVASPLELRLVASLYPNVELAFLDLDGPLGSVPHNVLAQLEGNGERTVNQGDALEVRVLGDGKERPSTIALARRKTAIGASFMAVLQQQVTYQVLAGGFVALLAALFLVRSVVRPLRQLQGHVAQLSASRKVKGKFRSGKAEEFRRLDQALTGMVDRVAVQRHEMVKDARRAGMSDVSMGVVHAAGNILNSINVSTKLLLRDVLAVDLNDMHSLARELEEHSDDLASYLEQNENGKFLSPFIVAMADAVGDLRSRCVVELESLDEGLGQAIDLIRSQEKYAVGPAMVEEVELSEVVERALEVAQLSVEGPAAVKIERQFDGVPLLRTDPHRLTSALINIIVNALEALQGDDLSERCLSLRVYGTQDRRVVVEVSDTGCGIDPGLLDQIFTSSFSDKAGHAGEGLHMAANVCQELGIAIGVMSEGPGTGSSIKLRIPTAKTAEGAGDLDADQRASVLAATRP
jgi:signal transduction histidine kinase